VNCDINNEGYKELSKKEYGYLFLLNTLLLLSTFEVVSKSLVGKIDPFQANFLRFFIGGLVLMVFVLIKGDIKISKKDVKWVVLVGVLGISISMSLLQLSLYVANAKASIVAVIFSSNPIFVCLFAALIDKERLKAYKLIGLLIGVIGIGVIFVEKIELGSSGYMSPLLALISAVIFGLYTVIGRKISISMGSLKMNSYSFIVGSLIMLPFLFIFKIPVITFDYSGIYQVIYLGVFVTGLAYYTYFRGLNALGSSKGSLVFFLKPALASFIAIIFLKESLTPNLFIGTLLVITGIVVAVFWPTFKTRGKHTQLQKKML